MKLNLLDKTNDSILGTTFGIPYAKGEKQINDIDNLAIQGENGIISSDAKITAYWPDKSVKWIAIAAELDGSGEYELIESKKKQNKIVVNETEEAISIESKNKKYIFNAKENCLLSSVEDVTGRIIIGSQKLIAVSNSKSLKIIKKAQEIENLFKNRVVVKIDSEIIDDNEVVFFNTTRIYIYLNSDEIKFTTTMFVADGANNTIVDKLGITTEYLNNEKSKFNRFAKFALESGPYCEPYLTLASRSYREHNEYYKKQLDGIKQDIDRIPDRVIEFGETNATWHNYTLSHNNPGTYKLEKNTGIGMQSVKIDEGIKSNGGVSISNGDEAITIVPKDFWQKYPAAMEVNNLGEEKSTITFWINYENEMRFNHYSDKHHFNCYEGFEFIKSDAVGTANTSEFYINITTDCGNNEFYKYSEDKQKPHILVADESNYRTSLAAGVYGKRRSINSKDSYLEDAADEMLNFYNAEIEQRSWYGYWDFGDVMHTFDNHRGQWWYDFGGYAWQNTELNPNMWLWYSFLRNLDIKSYKLAYNMSRHNADTDVYHYGEYKGLGSRHNVLHYGCSCKEPRISMAHLYRIFYFLHYDERIGEVMDMVTDVEKTMDTTGPFDEFYDKIPGKTYMRIGPDWASLCSNWYVKYERTLDEESLRKLNIGLDCIKKFKNQLLEGPEVLFDNSSYELESIGSGLNNGYHMTISFGAPQVWWDVAYSFDDTEFANALSNFATHYYKTDSEANEIGNGELSKDNFHWPEFAIGIYAQSAYHEDDRQRIIVAKRKLNEFMATNTSLFVRYEIQRHKKLVEYDLISTNRTAQWCLNLFQTLGYEDLLINE